MLKRNPKPQRPESPYKAAQRRAQEQRRREPPHEGRVTDHESRPLLFWHPSELILFPLADDDVIVIADTGETRRFAEPSYDAKGRRLYPSSIKSIWQQIVLFYFILGVIVGAALCYLFLKDALRF